VSTRLPSWRPGPTRDALFDGQTPEQFGAAVDEFLGRYRHRTLGVPVGGVVYQPMLEVLDELRRLDFTLGIVTRRR